jgi:hypothetical protein
MDATKEKTWTAEAGQAHMNAKRVFYGMDGPSDCHFCEVLMAIEGVIGETVSGIKLKRQPGPIFEQKECAVGCEHVEAMHARLDYIQELKIKNGRC